MQVTSFVTSHDCCESVGYRIETADGHRMAVATDLGVVTSLVEAGMAGCETVLIEANYDPVLLRMGSYPPYLKQRIASHRGHLSNSDSGQLAQRLLKQGSTRFVLGHLSRENNNPALAHRTVYDALTDSGAQEGVDFTLEVAPYDRPGRLVRL
jgi:phosphoribosyl 1,2-cyclic phosphodiesterase